MAKRKKEENNDDIRSMLADTTGDINDIVNSLNKEFKGSVFVLGKDNVTSDIKTYISTGSTLMDVFISNRVNGGVPAGRIVEIFGPESSGKTLIAMHMLADTQRKGGIPIFIDSENTADIDFMTRIGVDPSKLIYIRVPTVEKVFRMMDSIIDSIRNNESRDKPITIVWDSIAATPTEEQVNKDYGEKTMAVKARLLSEGFPKLVDVLGKNSVTLVLLNQLRANMGAMPFQDPWCVDPYTTKVKIRYCIND